MKTKLITSLRAAANALEQETFFYDWTNPACCNCGSLFCALTGKSSAQLNRSLPPVIKDTRPTWQNRIGQHCPITGMPADKLFRELFGYGLTARDMVNLEYLADEKVVARMNLQEVKTVTVRSPRKWFPLNWTSATTTKTVTQRATIDYENKAHVIAYMRAWADLLTEEGALDVACNEPENSLLPQTRD